MAGEASIRVSLNIQATANAQQYRSSPTGFSVNAPNASVPTPGGVLASLAGTVINLGLLTQPGLAWFFNSDPTNYVEVGLYSPTLNIFVPYQEIGPGEAYVLKMSRKLGRYYPGTGTGTTGEKWELMVRAYGAPCYCVFNVFEGLGG